MTKSLKLVLCGGALALFSLPAFAQMPQTVKGVSTTQGDTTKVDATMPAVGTTKPLPVADHYDGGQRAMYEFIAKNLQYPPMARRNRVQGQCIIGFTLNDDGSMSDVKIVKNIGGGCGEEALRLVKLLKFKGPGYAIKTSIPVNFKL